jgi:hypothetical protein
VRLSSVKRAATSYHAYLCKKTGPGWDTQPASCSPTDVIVMK